MLLLPGTTFTGSTLNQQCFAFLLTFFKQQLLSGFLHFISTRSSFPSSLFYFSLLSNVVSVYDWWRCASAFWYFQFTPLIGLLINLLSCSLHAGPFLLSLSFFCCRFRLNVLRRSLSPHCHSVAEMCVCLPCHVLAAASAVKMVCRQN